MVGKLTNRNTEPAIGGELLTLRMPEHPDNNREDQTRSDTTEHRDSSTSKQIELDAIYAQILQNIEDRRGAELLTLEEKSRVDEEEEDEKKEEMS